MKISPDISARIRRAAAAACLLSVLMHVTPQDVSAQNEWRYVVIAAGGGKPLIKAGDSYVAFALPR